MGIFTVGDKVITGAGLSGRVVCVDAKSEYNMTVLALIVGFNGFEHIRQYTSGGLCYLAATKDVDTDIYSDCNITLVG